MPGLGICLSAWDYWDNCIFLMFVLFCMTPVHLQILQNTNKKLLHFTWLYLIHLLVSYYNGYYPVYNFSLIFLFLDSLQYMLLMVLWKCIWTMFAKSFSSGSMWSWCGVLAERCSQLTLQERGNFIFNLAIIVLLQKKFLTLKHPSYFLTI